MTVYTIVLVFGMVAAAPRRITRETHGHVDWGYGQDNGPSTWHETYKKCALSSQSPIDLPLSTDDVEPRIPLLLTGAWGIKDMEGTIQNNGHSVQINLPDDYHVSGGGLPEDGDYTAVQFHFHWGSNNSVGSEHTVGGKAYPMEMHIVSYNANIGSVNDAKVTTDGLAVFGFFFTIGQLNEDLEPVVKALPEVQTPGSHSEIYDIDLLDLIEHAMEGGYYRYSGSLTTPTCDESVIWTNYKTPIVISSKQLKQFRELRGGDGYLVNNFRPTQELNDRFVKQIA